MTFGPFDPSEGVINCLDIVSDLSKIFTVYVDLCPWALNDIVPWVSQVAAGQTGADAYV